MKNHLFKDNKYKIAVTIVMILILAFAAACSSPTSESDHDNGDHEHESRIPNDGASIEILSPGDGATFKEGEDVVVQVQVENFELGVNGRHWHIYVDAESKGMVTGGDTAQALRNLGPGTYEISVFLTHSNHDELEEGDAVTISVE